MSSVARIISQGGIIAYPTEAVYGLGCDPLNQQAVTRLCALKQRPLSKGLILIAAHWDQLTPFVTPIPEDRLTIVNQSWPGPVTWLFPASEQAPKWICGDSDKIAVRVTNHPIAKALCDSCHMPLVSTSANRAGQTPLTKYAEVVSEFGNEIELIIEGQTGTQDKPSDIFDAITGEQYR